VWREGKRERGRGGSKGKQQTLGCNCGRYSCGCNEVGKCLDFVLAAVSALPSVCAYLIDAASELAMETVVDRRSGGAEGRDNCRFIFAK